MKKLHSLAFYALVAPAITLGSGALLTAQANSESKDLGEQSMGQDAKDETQGSQQDQDATKSRYNSAHAAQQTDDQPGMQTKGYLESPPAKGMAASDLIGTDLKTSDDETVGQIGDLIIDQDGRVVAVLVNAGGFLAMGEKQVAIHWNAIKMSGNPEDRDLRLDMTRDDLQSAPDYEKSAE